MKLAAAIVTAANFVGGEAAACFAVNSGAGGDRGQRLCLQQTRSMIPDFHLVDQNFQLRFHAGTRPRKAPYRELLPALRGILDGPAETTAP